MSPLCIEPEVESPVEEERLLVVDEQESEPEPQGSKQRIRTLLAEIFSGHEEFLGWTPD